MNKETKTAEQVLSEKITIYESDWPSLEFEAWKQTGFAKTVLSAMEAYAQQFKSDSVQTGPVWVTPTEWPELSDELHWRMKETKERLRDELVFNAGTMFAGPRWDRKTLRIDQVEYLSESPTPSPVTENTDKD